MKILKQTSKTEKVLLTLSSFLFLALLTGMLLPTTNVAYADESSSSSEKSSNESSEASSSSSDEVSSDETSTESTDEESVASVDEESVQSVDEVSTPSTDELSVDSLDEESTASTLSEDSLEDELSEELSTQSTSEVSFAEQSVSSGIDIDNFVDGEVYPVGDGAAFVYENERLFFLFPVQVEKQLTLDEDGTVLSVRQSLLSRLLDLLSF